MQKKLLAILMGCIAVGAAGSASAAFVESTTATENLVFAAPVSALTLEITPLDDLEAGDYPVSQKLADVKVINNSTDGFSRLGLRWTPGVASQIVLGTNQRLASITGNAGNQMQASIWFADGANSIDGYYLQNAVSQDGTLVAAINSPIVQTIKADIYPVSLDAAIWNP